MHMINKLHIIWDLDGTLIDSEQEVLEALIKSVRAVGLMEENQKSPFRVGPTVDKILEASFDFSVLTEMKKMEIIKNFRTNYDNCGFNHTPPFYGIEQILKDSIFIHHIVTNKPDLATNRIIEKLGWKTYFASVVTPYSYMKSANDKRKSKSELFALCMADYPKAKFVGIGDMDTDAKAALDNNIPAIGVLWGTGTREELEKCGCNYIISEVSELYKTLAKLQVKI